MPGSRLGTGGMPALPAGGFSVVFQVVGPLEEPQQSPRCGGSQAMSRVIEALADYTGTPTPLADYTGTTPLADYTGTRFSLVGLVGLV